MVFTGTRLNTESLLRILHAWFVLQMYLVRKNNNSIGIVCHVFCRIMTNEESHKHNVNLITNQLDSEGIFLGFLSIRIKKWQPCFSRITTKWGIAIENLTNTILAKFCSNCLSSFSEKIFSIFGHQIFPMNFPCFFLNKDEMWNFCRGFANIYRKFGSHCLSSFWEDDQMWNVNNDDDEHRVMAIVLMTLLVRWDKTKNNLFYKCKTTLKLAKKLYHIVYHTTLNNFSNVKVRSLNTNVKWHHYDI